MNFHRFFAMSNISLIVPLRQQEVNWQHKICKNNAPMIPAKS